MEIAASKEKVRRSSRSFSGMLGVAVKYAVLIAHSVFTLLPLVWIASNSFRNTDQILTSIRLIPESFDFSNYAKVITASNIPKAFYNSLSITFVTLALLLAVALPASFALSRFRFKASGYIYMFFAAAIFVPGITVLPMVFKLFNDLHLLGYKYSIVLSYVVGELPLSLFLLVMFMRAIPHELDESAIIDGCGTWKMFTLITVPMSRNGIVTVLILAFVAVWNDYLLALIMLTNKAYRTLSVTLAFTKDENGINYGMMSASIVFAVVPMIVFYLIIKDQLIKGMTLGAVKG
ncbi:carbohydrate ABC transporter permease [Paenibacillus thalictri]|nr:carbohydrate ABC transporter permease [Paenibacillus thalictri]